MHEVSHSAPQPMGRQEKAIPHSLTNALFSGLLSYKTSLNYWSEFKYGLKFNITLSGLRRIQEFLKHVSITRLNNNEKVFPSAR